MAAITNDQLLTLAGPVLNTFRPHQDNTLSTHALTTLEAAVQLAIAGGNQVAGAAPTQPMLATATAQLLIYIADNGATSTLSYPGDFYYVPDANNPKQSSGVSGDVLLAIARTHGTLRQWTRTRADFLYMWAIRNGYKWKFGKKGGLPTKYAAFGFDGADAVLTASISDEALTAIDVAKAVALSKGPTASYSNAVQTAAATRFSVPSGPSPLQIGWN